MKAPTFMKNKISRLLKTSGLEYTFTVAETDEYNQPVRSDKTITITGVYHEPSGGSNLVVLNSDAASVRQNRSPMILTLIDENSSNLKQGDFLLLNNCWYKISGVANIQQYDVAYDISLEEVVQ